MKYSKGKGAVCIVILLLLLDQILKIWIKTHLELHESIKITSWFYLYFTENPGMAFGIEAIGNIIDSVFYGVIFDHSFGQVATLFPEGGGYAGWLHGKVVDMFYFPLIETTWPDWLPIWGGQEFIFFRPIFNLADSAICVGVFLLLLFYRNTFSKSLGNEEK